MNLDKLLTEKRDQILAIARLHGAREVRVFGSVARGEATPTSDLDLLIEMAEERSLLDIVAIKQDLEEFLGCRVHVVTEAAVSPYLREKVLREAVYL
jgi:predicted nucleotidyltransferase